MKRKSFLFFILFIFVTCWLLQSAHAEYKSSNTRYQISHIRQMAHRNFTNKGRVKYIDASSKPRQVNGKITIGAVQLAKEYNFRELNIAVDMSNTHLKRHMNGEKQKLSIGKVTGIRNLGRASRALKINIVIYNDREIIN